MAGPVAALGERGERVLDRTPGAPGTPGALGADTFDDPAPGVDDEGAPLPPARRAPACRARGGHRAGRGTIDAQGPAAQKTLVGEDRERQAEALHGRRVDRDRVGADREYQRAQGVEVIDELGEAGELPGGAPLCQGTISCLVTFSSSRRAAPWPRSGPRFRSPR